MSSALPNALEERVIAELGEFADWCQQFSVAGVIGEFGVPDGRGAPGNEVAEADLWASLLELYYDELQDAGLWSLQWGTSEAFSAYELAPYIWSSLAAVQTLQANVTASNWSVTPASLAPGTYKIMASQAGGVVGPQIFTVGSAPNPSLPSVTITNPVNGDATAVTNPAIQGTCQNRAGDDPNVKIRLFQAGVQVDEMNLAPFNGTQWAFGGWYKPIPPGTYQMRAEQINTSLVAPNDTGYSDIVSFRITPSTVQNLLTLNSPTPGQTGNSTPTISGTATGTTPVTVTISRHETGTPLNTVKTSAGPLENHKNDAGVRRGVALTGLEFNTDILPSNGQQFSNANVGAVGFDYYPATEESWQFLASRGIKLARVGFRWERLQPTLNGPLDTAYLGYIQDQVERAAENNVDVVLDCHNFGTYFTAASAASGGLALGSSGLTGLHLADLWGKVAAYFRTFPNVVGYGLMNEPHDLPGGSAVWEAASQQCVNAIRDPTKGNDQVTEIYVAGHNWSKVQGWTANHPAPWITGTKIRYEAHHYFDTESSSNGLPGSFGAADSVYSSLPAIDGGTYTYAKAVADCIRYTVGYGATIPDGPQTDLGDNFSVEFWLRRSRVFTRETVLNQAGGGPTVGFFSLSVDFMYFRNQLTPGGWLAQFPADGNWHHVVVTKVPGASASFGKVYIDGVDRTLGGNTETFTNGQETYVGTDSLNTYPFQGGMSELAFYKFALSPGQVKSNYELGTGVPRPAISVVAPQILPTGIASGEAFGTALFPQTINIVPGISSAEAFGAAKLNLLLRLTFGIDSLEEFGNATLFGGVTVSVINLSNQGIPSAEFFGRPGIIGGLRPVLSNDILRRVRLFIDEPVYTLTVDEGLYGLVVDEGQYILDVDPYPAP